MLADFRYFTFKLPQIVLKTKRRIDYKCTSYHDKLREHNYFLFNSRCFTKDAVANTTMSEDDLREMR